MSKWSSTKNAKNAKKKEEKKNYLYNKNINFKQMSNQQKTAKQKKKRSIFMAKTWTLSKWVVKKQQKIKSKVWIKNIPKTPKENWEMGLWWSAAVIVNLQLHLLQSYPIVLFASYTLSLHFFFSLKWVLCIICILRFLDLAHRKKRRFLDLAHRKEESKKARPKPTR